MKRFILPMLLCAVSAEAAINVAKINERIRDFLRGPGVGI